MIIFQGWHGYLNFAGTGVLGMGIGRSEEGQLVIEIYVKKHTPHLESQLPKTLNGANARIVETGEVRAL